MKKFIGIFLLILLCSLAGLAQTAENEDPSLPGFKSDACSFFPDGNYRDCCITHDKEYFVGGSGKERRAADKRLYRCVKGKKGWKNKFIASMMYMGVRIGGVSFLPTPFRWGFGRKKIRKAREKIIEERLRELLVHDGPRRTAKKQESVVREIK